MRWFAVVVVLITLTNCAPTVPPPDAGVLLDCVDGYGCNSALPTLGRDGYEICVANADAGPGCAESPTCPDGSAASCEQRCTQSILACDDGDPPVQDHIFKCIIDVTCAGETSQETVGICASSVIESLSLACDPNAPLLSVRRCDFVDACTAEDCDGSVLTTCER